VVDDLHAREQRVEVAAMTSSSGDEASCPSPTGTKRGSISLGTFTRANVRRLGLGVLDEDRERQRQVRDVGKRSPEADGQRGEHREDLPVEVLGQLRALVVGDLVVAEDLDALLGQRGAQLALHAARLALHERRDPIARLVDDLGRRAAVPARLGEPRVDLVVQAGDPDMKNSSRFDVKIAANLRAP
jgi:hypothetical protein